MLKSLVDADIVPEGRADRSPVPAVSVVMDVSEGEDFLGDALASLAAQSFADFEIVLCAHGANAATEAIIGEWERREPRLHVIRSARLPLARAHNVAARAARAPLLARLDADDIAHPDRLARQYLMFASDHRLEFAGSSVEVVDRENRRLCIVRNPLSNDAIAAALADSCPVVHSTLMVRAEAFWRAGGYRKGLNISEDYDLYARLIEGNCAGNLAEPLVRYRVHAASLTSSRSMRMAIACLAIRAGIRARALGREEPFIRGVPSLRRVQSLLGLSRRDMVMALRSTELQSRTSRLILTQASPLRINGWLRNAAVRAGLRPAYSLAFRTATRVSWLWRGKRR